MTKLLYFTWAAAVSSSTSSSSSWSSTASTRSWSSTPISLWPWASLPECKLVHLYSWNKNLKQYILQFKVDHNHWLFFVFLLVVVISNQSHVSQVTCPGPLQPGTSHWVHLYALNQFQMHWSALSWCLKSNNGRQQKKSDEIKDTKFLKQF